MTGAEVVLDKGAAGQPEGGSGSSRGGVDRLATPHPLRERMPAVFADDEMMQRLMAGLDQLFAPMLTDLDCIDAYLQVGLAPEDFVTWLGSWVGAETGPNAEGDRLRAAVAAAARLHVKRGTVRGLEEAVALAFGVRPEIQESGGSSWSARPLGSFPGYPNPGVVVRLRVPDPSAINKRLLDDLVAAARPAHVPYQVEVLASDSGPDGGSGDGSGGGPGGGGGGPWTPPVPPAGGAAGSVNPYRTGEAEAQAAQARAAYVESQAETGQWSATELLGMVRIAEENAEAPETETPAQQTPAPAPETAPQPQPQPAPQPQSAPQQTPYQNPAPQPEQTPPQAPVQANPYRTSGGGEVLAPADNPYRTGTPAQAQQPDVGGQAPHPTQSPSQEQTPPAGNTGTTEGSDG